MKAASFQDAPAKVSGNVRVCWKNSLPNQLQRIGVISRRVCKGYHTLLAPAPVAIEAVSRVIVSANFSERATTWSEAAERLEEIVAVAVGDGRGFNLSAARLFRAHTGSRRSNAKF